MKEGWLSPIHTSNNVEATLLNATNRTILSTKSNIALTLLPFLATMLNEVSLFRQSWNKLNALNLFWLCRKNETSFDVVAKNGNSVEAMFNFLERTKFYNKLVRHCCHFGNKWNVASTLLLVWTGLYSSGLGFIQYFATVGWNAENLWNEWRKKTSVMVGV